MLEIIKERLQQRIDAGNNISVIGPRSSGKTTYLAALCHWPMQASSYKGKKPFSVSAVGSDSMELAEKASSIILEGGSLEPTNNYVSDPSDLKSFLLNINIRKGFRNLKIVLNAKDYPGEIFEDLANGEKNKLQKDFIEECLSDEVKGCILLFSDWSNRDGFYNRVIYNLFDEIDNRGRMGDLRLAVVMSKCERGELWPGRNEPELDLFQTHLPRTHGLLRSRIPKDNLSFFALSTFGVLGKQDPRPNRVEEIGQDGRRAILRTPQKWKPYGLIAPLYWIETGQQWNQSHD
jgi:hypothetical protein